MYRIVNKNNLYQKRVFGSVQDAADFVVSTVGYSTEPYMVVDATDGATVAVVIESQLWLPQAETDYSAALEAIEDALEWMGPVIPDPSWPYDDHKAQIIGGLRAAAARLRGEQHEANPKH